MKVAIKKAIQSPVTIVLLGMVFWFLFWFAAILLFPVIEGIIMVLISYPIGIIMFLAAKWLCDNLAKAI